MVTLRKLTLTALVLGIALCARAAAQDLQALINESEGEEKELSRTPSAGFSGVSDLGRLHLPEGDDVESQIISQDQEIDPDETAPAPVASLIKPDRSVEDDAFN